MEAEKNKIPRNWKVRSYIVNQITPYQKDKHRIMEALENITNNNSALTMEGIHEGGISNFYPESVVDQVKTILGPEKGWVSEHDLIDSFVNAAAVLTQPEI